MKITIAIESKLKELAYSDHVDLWKYQILLQFSYCVKIKIQHT